jgi:predicted metal-binding membrane protein
MTHLVPSRNLTKALGAAPTPRAGIALAATVGLAAAAWVIAVSRMAGMGAMARGPASELGSFGFFAVSWVAMMAAMMLPSAAPAVVRRVAAGGSLTLFIGCYIALWAVVGGAVYALYRPHGTALAGAVVIAAGGYELSPLKRRSRQACRDSTGGGFRYGLCCVGSTIGLMAMIVALGTMSIAWMVVIAVVVLAQKLLPLHAALDVPLALAIIALGIWIVAAPASVPGLVPTLPAPMPSM